MKKNINIHFSENIQSFDTTLKITKHLKTKQTSFLAFCALANPKKFYEMLEKNNFKVNLTKSFPDHHEYNNEDINKLKQEAKSKNLKLITTEKDYVRIEDKENIINVLPIEIKLSNKDENRFKAFLKEKING